MNPVVEYGKTQEGLTLQKSPVPHLAAAESSSPLWGGVRGGGMKPRP